MRTQGALALPYPAPAARDLSRVGAEFHARGWSFGTSGNYSVVLSRHPLRILITASGRDKGRLADHDFVVVGEDGAPIDRAMPRPSAETLLHVVLARRGGIGSVLHTHSVWGTLLSDRHEGEGEISIQGYEMLKGLAGVETHEHRERVPIFPNTQDMPSLAATIDPLLGEDGAGLGHGFLISGHGLYTWGENLEEARRHVEVLEFLFEVVGRRMSIPG